MTGLCILRSLAPIKKHNKGERWLPWKQALFEKPDRRGMSALVRADCQRAKWCCEQGERRPFKCYRGRKSLDKKINIKKEIEKGYR